MTTSTHSLAKGQLSGEKTDTVYIPRKEERRFFEEFENSLGLGKIETPREKPFLFLIDGIGGVGKHTLLTKFKTRIIQKYQEKNQHEPIIIWIDFQQVDTPSNPIDLMEYIDNEIEDKLFKIEENGLFQENSPKHKSTNEFYRAVQLYRQTLQQLCSSPIEGKDSVDKQQIENVRQLSEWGGKAIASYAAITSGFPALIPLASIVGTEVGKVTPILAETVLSVKDELLNKHKATRTKEDLQKLILLPLEILTPKFIKSLIQRSEEQAVILIFESHEKTRKSNGDLKLDDWFSKVFLSSKSRLIEGNNDHEVRFVISARKKLTSRRDWSQLEDYAKHKFRAFHIDYFTRSEAKQYLEKRLKGIYKSLSPDEENKFFTISHGHPKYLDLICRQREKSEIIDYSKINRDVAEEFLADLSTIHKKAIQHVSCCRWLDRRLTEEANQSSSSLLPNEDFNWFEWLIQRHFVNLDNDRYHFDDLARQVFRRSLFQEDRERFYAYHKQLADYFNKKASRILPGKPTFLKYEDPEWCEYIGEFLYHACFAQDENFESQFIYHLFASSYLHKKRVIDHSYRAIVNESDLDQYPLIHSSARSFLKTLDFISTYSWVAFELDSSIDLGKYRSKIKAAILLCKSHLNSLDRGIGKVAVLEYIMKNLSTSTSEENRPHYEECLLQEIENTASPIDPEFSSKLFMHSVCWQIDSSKSLEWCDQAIKYKSDNPNAWYRKGLLLEKQAKDMIAHAIYHDFATEKLEQALDCHEKALQIQPYDHRFWQSRGDVLIQLGENFECMSNQILDGEVTASQSRESKAKKSDGSIFQKIAYCQRAIECYKQALRFRPNDAGIEASIAKSLKKRDMEIEKLNQFSLQAQDGAGDQSDEAYSLQEYSYTIQLGDEIRLRQDIENGDQKDTKIQLQKALDLYCEAIQQKPEYPLGWYSRGLAYADLGKLKQSQEDLRKAIQDYDKSLELKSDLDWAFYNRGVAYYEIAEMQKRSRLTGEADEEYKRSLNDFDDALGINLEYEDAWYHRGLVLTSIGRHHEAIASYDKAIQIYQTKGQRHGEAFAWYDRGRSYAALNLQEEAIASYKRANAILKKDHPDICYHLGRSLQVMNKHQEAVNLFSTVIKIASTNRQKANIIYAYHGCGDSYRDMHLQDKAVESYQRALDHNPKYEPSCKALIKLMMDRADKYIEIGQYQSAIKQLKSAFERIEQFQANKVSDHLRCFLHELKYKSLCEILRLIELDSQLCHEFYSLGNRAFLALTQDKEYRIRLEAEENYSRLYSRWQSR